MVKTLYAKLALILVMVLCVSGAIYAIVALQTTRLYVQMLNQNLNRSLAENLVAEQALLRDGKVDREALEHVFHTYMIVNPSIEVYLLDPAGEVIAYSAPAGKVKQHTVDLGPVKTFLGQPDGGLPIMGDDPRHPEQDKVFSVAPVGPPHEPSGYLYVVLAGEHYASTTAMLAGSYILRLGGGVLVASVLLGLAVALVLVYWLTRRLRRLDRAMETFERSGFQDLELPAAGASSSDEIGRLHRRFKQMGERIQSQLAELRQTDALRRELIANVSHDLRTPITSLQGYLETLHLKEGSLVEHERREYLQIALHQTERLSKLVSELFELAKLEAGQTRLHREPFPLGDLVQDVAMKFQLQARDRGIDLQVSIPGDLPFVDGDIGLIERVLDNLLDNAIRHTPEGGVVEVKLGASNGQVSVSVADTGHGIPPEEIEHVFDRFYQVPRNERRAAGGTGLGLAIAKRILDLHASAIAVDSRPAAGTRFDFSLPACAA